MGALPNTPGNYSNLICYKKTEIIYLITFFFCEHFLRKGDRTIDQMVQAARSGKQNIIEGCAASATSSETEIKLINVAKASLKELLEDYEDFIKTRGFSKMGKREQGIRIYAQAWSCKRFSFGHNGDCKNKTSRNYCQYGNNPS